MRVSDHPDFARFWAAYPVHKGRKKAVEAFAKAMKSTTVDVLLQALAWQTRQPQWTKDGGRFIPYAQGWLNQERWTDEPFHAPPTKGTSPYPTQPQASRELAERVRAQRGLL